MRANGIVGAKRRGKPWRTTKADPQALRRPDLVQRDFSASRPNELWVADLSYLRCWQGLVYFAFVIDAYSRMIVGWQLATHMRTDLVLDALKMALGLRGPGADVELVHHSDCGAQGGFNWSSQHLVMEVVRDGWWQASGGDSCDARADLVAGAAVGCAARGPGPLLGSDRPWSVERGCRFCGWGVPGSRVEVVSPGWRDAANLVGPAVGALSLIC